MNDDDIPASLLYPLTKLWKKIDGAMDRLILCRMNSIFSNRCKCRLLPISEGKMIYSREDKPNILMKASTDYQALDREYAIHKKAMKLVRCPKLLDRFTENGVSYFAMRRIDGDSVADMYGSGPIPPIIWKRIHEIILKLYQNDIHYVDVTPYNFMIERSTGHIFVIDFGDAYECKVNWFLKEFLHGKKKSWNPDFE